jgi:hypothetical protein
MFGNNLVNGFIKNEMDIVTVQVVMVAKNFKSLYK